MWGPAFGYVQDQKHRTSLELQLQMVVSSHTCHMNAVLGRHEQNRVC